MMVNSLSSENALHFVDLNAQQDPPKIFSSQEKGN
jgi:hypothetical protein